MEIGRMISNSQFCDALGQEYRFMSVNFFSVFLYHFGDYALIL